MLCNIPMGDLPPGDAVKCGNRRDLTKKTRFHLYVLLGEDVRNCGAPGFLAGEVWACLSCGADKFTNARPK